MIVVTMTTWKPRVDNLLPCLDSLRAQTLRPDKFVFTLSKEDFTEEELPDALKADDVEIIWIDKNVKVWKKTVAILDAYPEAEIIECDDDWLYQPKFIEMLHNKHIETNSPVSVCQSTAYRGIYTHIGFGSLIKTEYLRDFRPTDEIIENVQVSELWLTLVTLMNGYKYVSCKEAMEGCLTLPQPCPFTCSPHINPQWEWLQKHYNFYKY